MIGRISIKMEVNYYNNIGIGIVSLIFVLNHSKSLPLAKAFLIFPLVSHSELLNYLGRKTTKIKSVEKLIIDKTTCFTNFNRRYCDSLGLAINSLQYLSNMEYVKYDEGEITLIKNLEFSREMGSRAEKINKASKNIADLLSHSTENLYLNLRVEL